MIDFYTWKTTNGHKVAIMLEETGLSYQTHLVDITKEEQFKPEFLQINPNNKIPVIIDHDGLQHHKINLSESGAILIYLAEKTGRFLPTDSRYRMEAMQWLMFQMSSVGPTCGQLHHFLHMAAEKVPYAIQRFTDETKRLYNVMNHHLQHKPYFAEEYSIADMAFFPWIHVHERHQINLNDYPFIKRWYQQLAERPAVKKALQLTEKA